MSHTTRAQSGPEQPAGIPKNDARLALWLVALLLVLGALVAMVIGFVDASIIAPDETEGPAPQIVVPGTLPD
jgi:hypothetical protein